VKQEYWIDDALEIMQSAPITPNMLATFRRILFKQDQNEQADEVSEAEYE
jgi:hypothetical protein